MKISETRPRISSKVGPEQLSPAQVEPGGPGTTSIQSHPPSFSDAIRKQRQRLADNLLDPIQQLDALRQSLKTQQTLSPRQLLAYQVEVNQLGLRIEMLSKVADTALTVTKRLQNGQ